MARLEEYSCMATATGTDGYSEAVGGIYVGSIAGTNTVADSQSWSDGTTVSGRPKPATSERFKTSHPE
jgi:hypothetical protein